MELVAELVPGVATVTGSGAAEPGGPCTQRCPGLGPRAGRREEGAASAEDHAERETCTEECDLLPLGLTTASAGEGRRWNEG